uniref:NR LBD domain-containing protein n=1 Tax=Caenorhabditis japonica TaxID=281687 RepID=A0A8R1HX37_CAEJA
MDPKAVRPDRDATGRHYQGRQRRSKLSAEDEGEVDAEWMRKLPVDMRTTLMQLLNIDLIVGGGDGHTEPSKIYPLPFAQSIRQLLEDPTLLDGKRTEMRYEAFREINPEELPCIAHRRLIAMIDWADHLFDMMDVSNMDDKVAIVKASYGPLMIFSLCANTARHKQAEIVCLSTFGYISRYAPNAWTEPYHFGNQLAERCIDELIDPLRKMNLKEEEITLLKAIIVLQPYLKTVTQDGSEAIMDLRDRIQETLYHVVRETHPKEVASSRFGNLLLFVPSVMMLGRLVMENLSFVDSFGQMNDRLVHDLLVEAPKVEHPPSTSPPHPNGTATSPVHTVNASTSQDEQLGTNGVGRRHSEPRMVHSSSTSSIESMNSFTDASSDAGYPPNQMGSNLPYNLSCNSLPAQINDFGVSLNAASSMPNLEMAECDPDYNVTITPDMYGDMRQAMNGMHGGMEIDDCVVNGAPNLERRDSIPQSPTGQQPMFYISTVESTKHKFTVTTTSYDRFQQNDSNGQIYGEAPNNGGFHQTSASAASFAQMSHQNGQMGSQQQQQQQQLCKTNSLPPQYMAQNYEMAQGYVAAQQNQMECDDASYINFNPPS